MPWLVHKETGKRYFVEQEQLGAAIDSGLYESPERVAVRDIAGQIGEVEQEDAGRAQEFHSSELASTEDVQQAQRDARLEDKYGGIGGGLLAGFEGAADVVSLGGYSGVARAFDKDAAMEIADRRRIRPGAATAGALAGAVATGGTGAAKTPAGFLAKGAEKLGRRAGTGLRGAATRFGAEGAAFGAGEGVAELALSEDPVTLERAIGTISSNALLGGGVGVGAGVLGKAAEIGLTKSRKVIADHFDKVAKLSDDGGDFVAKVKAYDDARGSEVLLAGAMDDPKVRDIYKTEGKAVLASNKDYIHRALDTPDELAHRPGKLRAALEAENKRLVQMMDEGEEALVTRGLSRDREAAKLMRKRVKAVTAKLEAKERRLTELTDDLAARAKAKKPLAAAQKRVEKAQADIDKLRSAKVSVGDDLKQVWSDMYDMPVDKAPSLRMNDAQRFIDDLNSGEIMTAKRKAAFGDLPGLLEQNSALWERVKIRDADPQGIGAKLAGDAKDKAMGAVGAGVVGMLGGGPIGAAAGFIAPRVLRHVGDMVTGRLAKSGGEAAKRYADAIDAALSTTTRATRAVTPRATKVLAAVRFAPDTDRPKQAPAKTARQEEPLVAAYQARERELKSQVQMGPNGIMMRPAARAALAENLAGARLTDPILADKIETIAARRVEFLASKLPKRPDVAGKLWRPSETEMRAFARYVAAVEDPAAVVERAADGFVSPEEAEALQTVYPEMYADLQRQFIERLPEVREDMPYQKRIALSVLLQIPIEPQLDPQILGQLQASFASEPGTAGGTQAPTPQPQFGSVKKSAPEPTPAQRRASPGETA